MNGARAAGWLVTAAVVLAAVLLTPVAGRTLERAALGLRHAAFQMDNEEGALLFQAVELRGGRVPYRLLDDFPYVAGTYPPVYLAAAAALHRPGAPDFFGGRLVSVAAMLAAALGLAALVVLRARHEAGALAFAFFLAAWPVYRWMPYFRVDALALAWTVAALAVVSAAPRRRGALAAAAVLCALAVFTRQTALSAPAAIAVVLLLTAPQRGLFFLGCFAGAVVVPLAALVAVTRGQFLVHTVTYNINTFSWADVAVWVRHLTTFYPWALAAGAVGLLALAGLAAARRGAVPAPLGLRRWNGAPESPELAFLPAAYLLFSVTNVLAAGKAGSAENYLLEPLAALAWFVGDALARLARTPGAGRAAAAMCAVLMVVQSVHLLRWRETAYSRHAPPAPRDIVDQQSVQRLVAAARGEVYAELAGLCVQAGKPVPYQPFIMSELARQGIWDPAPWHDAIAARRFELMIFCQDPQGEAGRIYTAGAFALVREHYEESARYDGGALWTYYIYRPKGAAETDSVARASGAGAPETPLSDESEQP